MSDLSRPRAYTPPVHPSRLKQISYDSAADNGDDHYQPSRNGGSRLSRSPPSRYARSPQSSEPRKSTGAANGSEELSAGAIADINRSSDTSKQPRLKVASLTEIASGPFKGEFRGTLTDGQSTNAAVFSATINTAIKSKEISEGTTIVLLQYELIPSPGNQPPLWSLEKVDIVQGTTMPKHRVSYDDNVLRVRSPKRPVMAANVPLSIPTPEHIERHKNVEHLDATPTHRPAQAEIPQTSSAPQYTADHDGMELDEPGHSPIYVSPDAYEIPTTTPAVKAQPAAVEYIDVDDSDHDEAESKYEDIKQPAAPATIRRIDSESEEGEISDDETATGSAPTFTAAYTEDTTPVEDESKYDADEHKTLPLYEGSAATVTSDVPMKACSEPAADRQHYERRPPVSADASPVIDLTSDDYYSMREQYQYYQSEVRSLREQVQKYKKERNQQQLHADKQAQQLQELTMSHERSEMIYKTRIRRYDEKIEVLEQEHRRNKQRVDKLTNANIKLSQRLQSSVDEIHHLDVKQKEQRLEMTDKLEKLQLHVTMKDAENQELQRQRDGLQYVADQLKQTQEQVSQWHVDRTNALRDLAQLQAKHLELKEQLETQAQSKRQTELILHETTRQRDHLHSQVATQGRFQQNYIHNYELVQQFNELQRRKDELVGTNLGLKRELTEEKRKSIESNANFTTEYNKVQQHVDQCTNNIKQLQTTVELLLTERDKLQKNKQTLSSTLLETRKESLSRIQALEKEMQYVNSNKAEVDEQLSTLQETYDATAEQLKTLQSHHTQLQAESTTTHQQLTTLQANFDALTSTHRQKSLECLRLTSHLKDFSATIEQLHAQVGNQKTKMAEMKQTQAGLNELKLAAMQLLQTREKELINVKHHLTRARQQLYHWQRACELLYYDVGAVRGLLAEYEENIELVPQQLLKWQTALEHWHKQIHVVE